MCYCFLCLHVRRSASRCRCHALPSVTECQAGRLQRQTFRSPSLEAGSQGPGASTRGCGDALCPASRWPPPRCVFTPGRGLWSLFLIRTVSPRLGLRAHPRLIPPQGPAAQHRRPGAQLGARTLSAQSTCDVFVTPATVACLLLENSHHPRNRGRHSPPPGRMTLRLGVPRAPQTVTASRRSDAVAALRCPLVVRPCVACRAGPERGAFLVGRGAFLFGRGLSCSICALPSRADALFYRHGTRLAAGPLSGLPATQGTHSSVPCVHAWPSARREGDRPTGVGAVSCGGSSQV